MNWLVKFCRRALTDEELQKKILLSSNGFPDVIYEKDDQMYWSRQFPEFKKRYLLDYPKSRRLDKYRLECEQQSSQNESDLQIESSNLRIESSSSNQIIEPEIEILSEDLQISDVDSEDSNYSQKRKKQQKDNRNKKNKCEILYFSD